MAECNYINANKAEENVRKYPMGIVSISLGEPSKMIYTIMLK